MGADDTRTREQRYHDALAEAIGSRSATGAHATGMHPITPP
jgi:hypothetical protein